MRRASSETETGRGSGPPLPIAVNADSMATWVLPALAPLGRATVFDLHREDQEHTSGLLRDGTVMAAVTAEAEPVPGCTVTPLGVMRYRPMATGGIRRAVVPRRRPRRGARPGAPVVVFDRKDDLQHGYLRGVQGAARAAVALRARPPPTTSRAVRLGFGWGMVPDLQLRR